MFTRFEEYAAASMLGAPDSPPRVDGKLLFTNRWERDVFGLALSLAKAGCFEWEDFRQSLIASIAEWEAGHADWSRDWDYYQRWLQALEEMVLKANLIDSAELERRTALNLRTTPAHPSTSQGTM